MKEANIPPKAIIIGATSGIGREVARILAQEGWQIGIAGRRNELLNSLQSEFPQGQILTQSLDITQPESINDLQLLIDRLGSMDLFLLSSGIGFQNVALDPEIELRTAHTNSVGFVRMVTHAYNYFKEHATTNTRGHIAVISSIAGTKGIGVAPAYSATKRFQNSYIEALTQLAHIQKLPIDFTDIRPGFVATDLLRDNNYPMLMQVRPVAQSIVKALRQRKQIHIIDWKYRILVCLWKLIPHWLWIKLKVTN